MDEESVFGGGTCSISFKDGEPHISIDHVCQVLSSAASEHLLPALVDQLAAATVKALLFVSGTLDNLRMLELKKEASKSL